MKLFSGFAICIALMMAAEVFSFPNIDYEGFIWEIRRDHKCRQCTGEECLIPPEPCRHGTYYDRCGYVNCYQGPGNFCHPDATGLHRCAKGLTCLCNECRGCLKDPRDGHFHCTTAPPCGGSSHLRLEK